MELDTKNDIHKKWSVILAFILPIILIIGVAVSSGTSFLKASTEYDFIYALCDWNSGHYYYYDECTNYLNEVVSVDENGKYVRGNINPTRDSNKDGVLDIDESYDVRFFYHDSALNESREILESELQKIFLNPLITSPDGASIEYGYQGGANILFFDVNRSSYEYRLVKGNRSKRLNLITETNRDYDRGFEFVGWVINKE